MALQSLSTEPKFFSFFGRPLCFFRPFQSLRHYNILLIPLALPMLEYLYPTIGHPIEKLWIAQRPRRRRRPISYHASQAACLLGEGSFCLRSTFALHECRLELSKAKTAMSPGNPLFKIVIALWICSTIFSASHQPSH